MENRRELFSFFVDVEYASINKKVFTKVISNLQQNNGRSKIIDTCKQNQCENKVMKWYSDESINCTYLH